MRVRVLILLLSALALSGCGFHPRTRLVLPESVGTVQVVTADAYSPLGLELSARLERAGFSGPADGKAASTLRISEAWSTVPLSVDQFARVREYVVRYRVEFSLTDAAGTVLVAPQTVELSREYTYDTTASAGSPAEQELIQRELRRDMQGAILRRLDVVLRPKG